MHFITSRISQLIARGILAASATGVGVFGEAVSVNEAQANEIAGLVVSGILAALAAGWDFYIHRQNTGGVLKPAGTPKENP